MNLNKKNIIAIIPARGGSKGIPKKNITNFLNKPLITHTIEYAKKSILVDNIYVSTDDEDICKLSLDSGIQVINRPGNLSNDTASTESALLHALDNIKTKPDAIVLLQPTSPLRPKGSLDKAIKHFFSEKYDSLLSISPTHRFFWETKNKTAIPKYNYKKRPRRQDIPLDEIKYVENGSLYISTYDNLISNQNRLGGNIGFIIFNEQYSYEIDTPTDLKILTSIAQDLK
jgi:N-acylneuraminate cytidylyltransferase